MIDDLVLSYKRFKNTQEIERIKKQEKQYKYYIGDESAILNYLEDALSINFDTDTTVDMIKHYINLTKKVIDQLSILYNKSAIRTILIDDRPDEELTKYYNSLLPININTVDKMAIRLARLSNVSLTQVFFDKKKRRLVYRVEPAYKFYVESNEINVNEMELLAYDRYYTIGDKEELYTVVWTNEAHYKLDSYDNNIPVGNNLEMVNPYKDSYGNGIIPFAVLRVNESEDFWGEGQNDLINFNEIINIMLSDLLDSGILMGSAVTPVATNLDLVYKAEDGSTRPKKLSIGMKHPITAENVRSDMVTPKLEFIKPDTPIQEIRDIIDWHIKLIAITKGLNPNSLIMETKSTSGYSKIMDAMEEIHIREDIIEQTRIYEEDRFNITKSIINAHANELNLKPIPDNAKLKVNFAEVNIPKTVQELWLDRELKFKYNLQTPSDWLLDDDKDLEKSDAEYRINENSLINSQFKINEFKQATNVEQTDLKTQ